MILLIVASFAIPVFAQYKPDDPVTHRELFGYLQQMKTFTSVNMLGWKLTFWTPTKIKSFDTDIEANFVVYEADSAASYYVTTAVTANQNMAWVFTSGNYQRLTPPFANPHFTGHVSIGSAKDTAGIYLFGAGGVLHKYTPSLSGGWYHVTVTQ